MRDKALRRQRHIHRQTSVRRSHRWDLELNWMAGSLTDGKSKRQKPTRLWKLESAVRPIKTKSQTIGRALVCLDDEFAVGLLVSPPFQRCVSSPFADQKGIPGRV